jgi:cobalamin biosynthesis protein CbiG
VAATGLVVRLVAPLVGDKANDPAVVSLGQDGRHVISLLSGHLGRANDLALAVAAATGGQAVINTATDIEGVPALEALAADLGLRCPDLGPLPAISRRLCEGLRVTVHDPHGFLAPSLAGWPGLFEFAARPAGEAGPSVVADYLAYPVPAGTLVLRPPALAAGLGCHRDCPPGELEDLLTASLGQAGLDRLSVAVLATLDSRGQAGLAPALLAGKWGLPLLTYAPAELSSVEAPTPSETVLRRIGAASVCEASARLAARMGPLLVNKRKGARATCAVALIDCLSSAWAPPDRTA